MKTGMTTGMKTMKRNGLVILLALMLAIAMPLMSSCKLLSGLTGGSSEDVQSQNGSQQTSQENQNASGDQQDNSQGTVVTGSDQWPADVMGGLPVPAAKVTAIFKDETKKEYVVTFAEMELASAEGYAVSFRNMGFANDLDVITADSIMISGTASSGAKAMFAYSVSEKSGTVTYIHEPEAVVSIVESIDMTDADSWPANFLAGVPELQGKITYVSYDGETNVIVDLSYVEKADFEAFIETVKQAGFTIDADESKSTDGINFSAYNEADDWFYSDLSYGDEPNPNNTVRIEMYKAG
ncbi:MAG: hypothetical protein PHN99_05365 [Eubacteriales bacterium]|nr:hypothetical protein [Eubacteriales bacterium]